MVVAEGVDDGEMDQIIDQIKDLAQKYCIDQLVLFGSRARGDHSPYSDYDIAVFGKKLSSVEEASFWSEIEEIETLKKIDLVFVNDTTSEKLLENIRRDGVILYEGQAVV